MKQLRFFQMLSEKGNLVPVYYISLCTDNEKFVLHNINTVVELDLLTKDVAGIIFALTKAIEEDAKREITLNRLGNAKGGGRIVDYIKYVQAGKDLNSLTKGTASLPRDFQSGDFLFSFYDAEPIIKVERI